MNTEKAKVFLKNNPFVYQKLTLDLQDSVINLMSDFAEQEKRIAFEAGAREMIPKCKNSITMEKIYNRHITEIILPDQLKIILENIDNIPLPEYKEGI